MKNIAKKAAIFILILIILIGLANVLFRFVISGMLKFNSNSMLPTYSKGDILFYSESETYNIGDVIVFSTTLAPIAHRVIKINEDGTYETKGDHNAVSNMEELRIQKSQIMGKVNFSIKFYVFYPMFYTIQLLIALLLARPIYKKLNL